MLYEIYFIKHYQLFFKENICFIMSQNRHTSTTVIWSFDERASHTNIPSVADVCYTRGQREPVKRINKSNATASDVQVEENLQEQLRHQLHFRQEWAFTTLGRSRFESLLAHVSIE